MAELPLFVVHGAWVWKLICAAIAVGSVGSYARRSAAASSPASPSGAWSPR